MQIHLRDEYIKLGQALKAADLVEDGVEAKAVIQNGEVSSVYALFDQNMRQAMYLQS